MLRVENVEVVYDDVALVLNGVSLTVPPGGVVALLGANGAGKTTLLRAICGLLDIHDGEVTRGSIIVDDEAIHGLSPARIVSRGITLVPEGRRILAELTVDENLRVGAHTNARAAEQNLERVFSLFPALVPLRARTAGYLSGGEQQMLAMGRALMSGPRYLLLDEPTLGLAPRIVDQIRHLIVEISQQGTAILLVEQNTQMALEVASHGYVMETGRIVMDNPAAELLDNDDIQEFYLGTSGGNRNSFAEVKHYRRRKRWLS